MDFNLYTKDYILRGLRGEYEIASHKPPTALERVAVTVVRIGMLLSFLVISIVARIPLLDSFIEMIARVSPRNAIGFFLRGAYYKNKLKKMGKNVIIDMGVTIWAPEQVEIGDYSHIDTNVLIYGGSGQGFVKIGRYVHVTSNTIIAGRGGVTIGDYVGIAAGCAIYSGTNSYEDPDRPGLLLSMSATAPPEMQYVVAEPIVIEDYAFLGLRTVVLPGVHIGRGAVIGTTSTVTRDIGPYRIAGGSPARAIGERPHSPEEEGQSDQDND